MSGRSNVNTSRCPDAPTEEYPSAIQLANDLYLLYSIEQYHLTNFFLKSKEILY